MNSTVLFKAIMAHQLRIMRDNKRLLMSRYNAEAVHLLRVAALRTDFALSFFARSKQINQIKKSRAKLKAARQIMGEARNHDLLLFRLRQNLKKSHLTPSQTTQILSAIQSRKNNAHRALIRTLEQPTFERTLKDLTMIKNHYRVQGLSGIIKGSFKRTSATLCDYRRERIKRCNLHKIRIAFKKLRYACEFLEDIDKPRMQKALKFAVRFQDLLGDRQDSLASIEILSSLHQDGTLKIIKMEKKFIKDRQKDFEKLWRKSFQPHSVVVKLYRWCHTCS